MTAEQNPYEPPKLGDDAMRPRFEPAPGMSIAEFFKDRQDRRGIRMRRRRWGRRCNLVAGGLVGVSFGTSVAVSWLFANAARWMFLGQLAAALFLLAGILIYIFAPVVWFYKNSS